MAGTKMGLLSALLVVVLLARSGVCDSSEGYGIVTIEDGNGHEKMELRTVPADFGPGASMRPVVGGIVDVGLGCDPSSFPASLSQSASSTSGGGSGGSIVLADRGNCSFYEKVTNAESSGALYLLLVNNEEHVVFPMAALKGELGIPSSMLTQADGAVLRSLGTVIVAVRSSSSSSSDSSPETGTGADNDPDSPRKSLFAESVWATLFLVLVSEIGDKTFFAAILMSMRCKQNQRVVLFVAANLACAIMACFSSLAGSYTTLIPAVYTTTIPRVLCIYFGLRMFHEAWSEPEEVEKNGLPNKDNTQKAGKKNNSNSRSATLQTKNTELKTAKSNPGKLTRTRAARLPQVATGKARRASLTGAENPEEINDDCGSMWNFFWKTVLVTMMTEFGDRSQLTMFVMSSKSSKYNDLSGVIIGGILGHFVCTFFAIVGGSFLVNHLSPKAIAVGGGVSFLLFAALGFNSAEQIFM